ncbi:hypothetical protein AYI69_g7646 [Smittium culicis]|uniref:Uncharacterized protein n=1 Tax=Smittium culicis TaxID=133412 RepID=A0A1R1XQK2_9FUNG|nr:hypothetical protein AYI69_g7646 [Smittium culicis]
MPYSYENKPKSSTKLWFYLEHRKIRDRPINSPDILDNPRVKQCNTSRTYNQTGYGSQWNIFSVISSNKLSSDLSSRAPDRYHTSSKNLRIPLRRPLFFASK